MREIWANKRLLFFCYFINLSFGLILAYFSFNELSKLNLVALKSLIVDFDYMYFSEAIRFYENELLNILKAVFKLLVIYFSLNTLFSGGIIDAVLNGEFRLQRFLIFSFRYFFKTLVVGSLVISLLCFLLGLSGVLAWVINKFFDYHTHKTVVLAQIPSVILAFLSILFSFIIWDYARIKMFQGISAISAFFESMKEAVKNPKLWRNIIFLLFCSIILHLFYILIDYWIGMRSLVTIFLLIIIQQVFVFLRIILRLTHYKMLENFKD